MLGNTLVTIQTGAGRQAGQPALRHRRRRHREGILPRAARRPEDRPHRLRRLDRGRHEHRGSGPRHARKDPHLHRSIRRTGFMPHHGRAVAFALGLDGDLGQAGAEAREAALRRLRRHDASQIEINPLVVTDDGKLLVLDAKMASIPTPMFRHPDLEALRDESEEDPMELEASKYDLAYIKLDGNIGCMVNGAGLAMATMDIIKLNGAVPGQLPRRRRRRLQGEGDRGVQDHPLRPDRRRASWSTSSAASCAATSSPRASSRPRARSTLDGAAGGPARRHQCRGRQGDPRRRGLAIVPADDLGDAAARSSPKCRKPLDVNVRGGARRSRFSVIPPGRRGKVPHCGNDGQREVKQ